jgi:hypothetical protein
MKIYYWKIECYKSDLKKVLNYLKRFNIKPIATEDYGKITHTYFRASTEKALLLKNIPIKRFVGAGLHKVISKPKGFDKYAKVIHYLKRKR